MQPSSYYLDRVRNITHQLADLVDSIRGDCISSGATYSASDLLGQLSQLEGQAKALGNDVARIVLELEQKLAEEEVSQKEKSSDPDKRWRNYTTY